MSNIPEQKLCSACGESFGCGAKLEGCWCAQINISSDVSGNLSSKYDDCLCPKCLVSLATEATMILTYPDGSMEIVAGAVRVDTQNFHEGMFDFYDASGNLLKQVDMGSGVSWEEVVRGREQL